MISLIRKLLNDKKQRASKKQRAFCLLPGESVDEKLICSLINSLAWPPNVARC